MKDYWERSIYGTLYSNKNNKFMFLNLLSQFHINKAQDINDNAAAAIAAKSLQSCPTLCDPIDGSPPGPAVPGIL